MRLTVDPLVLRRGVLAVSVLDEVELLPCDDGIIVPGSPEIEVGWRDLARACGHHEPASAAGRHRLVLLLRQLRRVADLGELAPAALQAAAVLVALPRGHLEHLGRAWAVERLAGGALDLGVGVRGLLEEDPDGVLPLAPRAAAQAGVVPEQWWPQVRRHADQMSALAVEHLTRDGRFAGILHPIGGCDVLALLAGPALRAALADGDGSGMRAVAVPTRLRGWYDLARIDPAYVAAAWGLTDQHERGVDQPLLVTRDEVATPRRHDSLARHALDLG